MVYSRLWELFHRTMNDAKKAEWIFFHLHCKTVGYHNDMYPPSAQGQAREVPVQDQVDEYEVIGPDGYGYPIYALKQNHKALYGSLISEQDMAKAYGSARLWYFLCSRVLPWSRPVLPELKMPAIS